MFLFYFSAFILGLAIGSFVNSFVWRTREKSMVRQARSICPNCRVKISWRDNIPLLSFIILRCRCRHCGQKISWQYFLTEFFMGGLFLLAGILHSQGWSLPTLTIELIRDWAILAFLLFIFLYDLNYMEILPESTLIPGAALFFLSWFFGWHSLSSLGLGVLVGAGFFSFLLIISRGRWIGGGDAMLGFFMGAILGWPLIVVAVFISYIIGAVISLLLIGLRKKTMKGRVPFGVFLALGTAIAMFWGESILEWYLGFI